MQLFFDRKHTSSGVQFVALDAPGGKVVAKAKGTTYRQAISRMAKDDDVRKVLRGEDVE